MPGQNQLKRFEALLRGHTDALYRTALRFTGHPATAEDLVQEACLRAYRSFITSAEPDNFRAWVFRILTNLCIDHSRHETARATSLVVAQEVDELPETGKGPAQNFANARLGRDLAAAFGALPVDLRLVVHLVLVEGMTYREVEGTVRSRLNRARGLLREQLADHAPGAEHDAASDRVVPFPDVRKQGK
jgi:RNA polymerase sigma-70 factor (ECF subfamily)